MRLFPLLLPLLLPVWMTAQVISEPGDLSSFIFSRPHFSVTVMGGLAMKADVQTNSQQYDLGSSPQVAFGGGANYHLPLSRQLSLITGIHVVCPVRNIEYYIPKDAFNPPMPADLFHNKGISTTAVILLSLPFSLEQRWFRGDEKYFYLSGGVSLNFVPELEEGESHFATDVNGQEQMYFQMDLQTNSKGKPWINYHIGGGHAWVLKSKNILSAGILANLSVTRISEGNFTININGQPPINGQYYFKGSYAAISVSYIFTGAKKRIKKLMK